jgi:4'-phosphopantetheinyl transferase
LSEDWSPGPDHPSLTAGEVHVWRARLDGPRPGLEGLPAPERERAATFLRDDAAGRWVASRWALRQVLSRYLDAPAAEIALELDENDKPQLADRSSGLRFNLSHSGDLALVAVTSDREVGVDVEEIESARDLLALAERALASEAVAEIRAAAPAEQPLAFYRAWTRHEARLKCLGIGLTSDRFHPFPRDNEDKGGNVGDGIALVDLEVAPGYAGAVAVTGEVGTLRRWSHSASAA